MRLIKLTSRELIEEFFAGEESVEINESCKVVTDTIKIISETGALIMVSDGIVSVKRIVEDTIVEDTNEPVVAKKPSKKKK